MDFPSQIFSSAIQISGNLLALVWLALSVRYLQYKRLYDNRFTQVYFGACVGVLVLWSIHAGVSPTLHFHLLGVTVLTLMFGWQYASLGVVLVLMGTTLNGQGGWAAFGMNLLCMGLIPISLTWGLLRWTQRRLPHNFFIYVYINAFLASGLSMLATGAAAAGLLWITGIHTPEWLGYQYLPYFPLMAFSEAVMNGMIMTLLVALRPDWVCSFDDDLYIKGK